mmetsp:Transcript_18911/g.46849  ORF Transcript_18911/g.46849 Transcript_18911/m.46849 type:complete len:235 (-) Transcript_18911:657-1361(-)
MIPAKTAMAKSFCTVKILTRAITKTSSLGIFRTNRRDDQLKVDWHTNSMTPTKEAMGTEPKSGAAATIPRAKKMAMLIPEKREIPPPLWTLMILCPNRAHPPMPPVNPDKMLPVPWPTHSRLPDPLVPSSTSPSNSCIVKRDSKHPTAAMVSAYGKTTLKVSAVNGTLGNPILGRTDQPPTKVEAPAISASVLVGSEKRRTTTLAMVTAPKEGGMALVNLGINLTNTIVKAAIP